MKKILFSLFFVVSCAILVSSADATLEEINAEAAKISGVMIKDTTLTLNNTDDILWKTMHLRSAIMKALKQDQFTSIRVRGKKGSLGYTLEDMAPLKLKKLETLILDLFYMQSDVEKDKQYIQDLFKEWKGLEISMRTNEERELDKLLI